MHDWIVHPRDPAPAARCASPSAGRRLAGGLERRHARRPHRAQRARGDPGGPPVYDNTDSHWWDASQVYGSTPSGRPRCEYAGGRLLLGDDGGLPLDPSTGLDLTGVSGNWWTGLSLLHWLFAKEHNRICSMLADAHPRLSDEGSTGWRGASTRR